MKKKKMGKEDGKEDRGPERQMEKMIKNEEKKIQITGKEGLKK